MMILSCFKSYSEFIFVSVSVKVCSLNGNAELRLTSPNGIVEIGSRFGQDLLDFSSCAGPK